MRSARPLAEAVNVAAAAAADRERKQWGEMGVEAETEYCCCQLFPITHGVYLIALHCLLQAAYAVGLVTTSYHRPKEDLMVLVTAGSGLSLVPTGILIFWANLYHNWRGARLSAVLVLFVACLNTVLGGLYFVWFIRFKANSQLDRALFWKSPDDWITSSDLPLTFWHFLSFELIPVNLIWFYYARVMCKLSVILRARRK